MNYAVASQELISVIENYFQGIYGGDIKLLRSVFHHSLLFGDVKGNPYQKNIDDYLTIVANRKSPKLLNEPYKMNIISIDVLGLIAFVKVHVPMLGYNYYDYLSLSKVDQQWKIVNKLFTHVE